MSAEVKTDGGHRPPLQQMLPYHGVGNGMIVGVGVGVAVDGVAVGVGVAVGLILCFRDGVDHSISSSDSITLTDRVVVPADKFVVADDADDVIGAEVEDTVAVGLG